MSARNEKAKCVNCDKEFLKFTHVKNHRFCCEACKIEYYRNNPEQETLTCDNCGKVYQRRKQRRYNNHFCCLDCELEFKHNQKWEVRQCEICKTDFECLKTSKKKMCSIQCQGVWQSKNLRGKNANGYNHEISHEERTLKCEWCSSDFEVLPYKINTSRFCSENCRREWYSKVFSQSEEWKEKSRINAVRILEDGLVSTTMTEPQVVVNEILDELKVAYINEKGFTYCTVDNYLSEHNLIIEVMGTYWHTDHRFYPTINYDMQVNRIRMDKIKHTSIKNDYDIEILYLWEYDILNNKEMCVALIKKYISKIGKLENYHSFNYEYKNKLLLIDNVVSPYMEWEIEKLHGIIDTRVKEKMSRKQHDRWITFNCETCGKETEQLILKYNTTAHHYCSTACSSKAQIRRISVQCNNCNSQIEVTEHKYKTNQRFFCNQACQHEYQREKGFKKDNRDLK